MEVTESSYCYVRLIFTVFDALFYVYCIRMKSDTFFTLTNYLFILLVALCTRKNKIILSDDPSNQKQVNLSKKWCLLCVQDWGPWWNIGLANDQKECFFFQWQMRPMRKYPSKNIDKLDFCFKMFLSASYSENVFYICFFSMISLLKTWVNIYMSWYTLNHPGKEIQESWTCLSGNCVFSGSDKKSLGWVTKLIQLLLNVVCWTYLDTNLSEGSW